MLVTESREPATPCAICAICEALAPYAIWGAQLCPACCGAWYAVAPNAGEMAQALGLVGDLSDAAHQRTCDEYARRTAAWVAKSRRAQTRKVAI